MNIDFNISIWKIIEVLMVMGTMITVYIKFLRRAAQSESSETRIKEFKENVVSKMDLIKSQLDGYQSGMTNSLTGIKNDVAELGKRLTEADDRYVRKDIFKATVELINLKIAPIAKIEEALSDLRADVRKLIARKR